MTRRTIDLHVNPSEENMRVGQLMVRFLLTGDNSTGSIAALELTVPGAQRLPAPAHSHDHYEETIYGIDGVLTWTVDGKQLDVGPGQALCSPRGAVHRFDNNEAGEVINEAAGGPPDRAKMEEIMRRHGLTPAPPQVPWRNSSE
jgi:quercetin dioxygenase-like cupin family protein